MEMYLLLDQQLVLEKLSLIGVIGKPNSRPACPTKVMEQAPQCSYSFSLFLENLDLHIPGKECHHLCPSHQASLLANAPW